MSNTILEFRIPKSYNDNSKLKYISKVLSSAVEHIEGTEKIIAQLQDPNIFHPRDIPSSTAYLKMSLALMERASETIHDILDQHYEILSDQKL